MLIGSGDISGHEEFGDILMALIFGFMGSWLDRDLWMGLGYCAVD